ncbi:MAG: fimbrial protein [Serratia sp. (in: enterobacteria)]|uniref:fimbrial protein n=1 Tax=Serratia sp. (in: enterobacteria) TaxID=616 RepID=UPI003F4194B3
MLLPALAVLPGTQAGAADNSSLNINGNVIAAACTVGSDLVAGQAVSLGTLGRTKFQVSGDADSTWHNFSLELTNCPVGTTSSTVTFSGTPDATDATLLANTEAQATAATNMAVQMSKQSDNSAILSNGSTMTVNVDTTTGTASFPLAARMKTPTGNVQAGKVSSTVLVDFTYQ